LIPGRSSLSSIARNAITGGPRIVSKNSTLHFVCEPVLAEAMYLLARYPRAQDVVMELVQNGALEIAFRMKEHIDALQQLLRKYRDTPMSLADACIVRMAEIHDQHAVLTLDSDFTVYRKHGRNPLTIIHPQAT
jgi:uncharacterized protein